MYMLLKVLLTAFFLFISVNVYATFPPVNYVEEDGSPSVYPYQVKVSNGSLTDNGDNTISITTGSTAYDDIGDPDADTTIDFGAYDNSWTS